MNETASPAEEVSGRNYRKERALSVDLHGGDHRTYLEKGGGRPLSRSMKAG